MTEISIGQKKFRWNREKETSQSSNCCQCFLLPPPWRPRFTFVSMSLLLLRSLHYRQLNKSSETKVLSPPEANFLISHLCLHHRQLIWRLELICHLLSGATSGRFIYWRTLLSLGVNENNILLLFVCLREDAAFRNISFVQTFRLWLSCYLPGFLDYKSLRRINRTSH